MSSSNPDDYLIVASSYASAGISMVGVVVNGCIIGLSVKHWKTFRRSSFAANLTILSISIADFGYVSAVGLPVFISRIQRFGLENNEIPHAMCLWSGVGGMFFHGTSLLFICLLSYLRYAEIVVLTHDYPTKKAILLLSLAVFSCFVVVGLPFLFGTGYAPTASQTWCTPLHYPPENPPVTPALYYVFSTMVISLLVVIMPVIAMCYYKIYRYIDTTTASIRRFEQSHAIHGHPSHGDRETMSKQTQSKTVSVTPNEIHRPVQATVSVGQSRRPTLDQETTELQRLKITRTAFKKLLVLWSTTFLLWTPIAVQVVYEALCGYSLSPGVDALVQTFQTSNPMINGILILTLVNHYKDWSHQLYKDIKTKFSVRRGNSGE